MKITTIIILLTFSLSSYAGGPWLNKKKSGFFQIQSTFPGGGYNTLFLENNNENNNNDYFQKVSVKITEVPQNEHHEDGLLSEIAKFNRRKLRKIAKVPPPVAPKPKKKELDGHDSLAAALHKRFKKCRNNNTITPVPDDARNTSWVSMS